MTPYGGLLPVATILEKLGFQALVEANVTVKRVTKVMNWYRPGYAAAPIQGIMASVQRGRQQD